MFLIQSLQKPQKVAITHRKNRNTARNLTSTAAHLGFGFEQELCVEAAVGFGGMAVSWSLKKRGISLQAFHTRCLTARIDMVCECGREKDVPFAV